MIYTFNLFYKLHDPHAPLTGHLYTKALAQMTAAEEQAGRPRGYHRLLLSAPLLLMVVVRAEHLGVREGCCVEQELVGAAWSWWVGGCGYGGWGGCGGWLVR